MKFRRPLSTKNLKSAIGFPLMAATLLVLPLTYGVYGQEENPSNAAPTQSSSNSENPSQVEPIEQAQAATVEPADGTPLVPTIKLTEKPPAESLFEKVEGGFGYLVGWLDWGLFFKVFYTEREYVQMDHVENYVRDRGADAPFLKLDPNGTYPAASLSLKAADALMARGKLQVGLDSETKKTRSFREGELDGREVDFVSIVIDNSTKYVAKEAGSNEFVKLLGKRELVSEDPADVLTTAQAEQLNRLGRLLKSKDGNAFVLTEKASGAPFVVIWLAVGSVFFTLFMAGVNFWAFGHAIGIVRGKYDNPNEPGEVSHLQALSSALSATIGLGNIAGVTIAMTIGGPGAFFWMLACGLFGMTSKFVECTLGQKYRRVKEDGTILGGPMQYLSEGLREIGLGPLGSVLAVVFAAMCIMASFGGGNMFQANQSGATVLAMWQESDHVDMGEFNKQIGEVAAHIEANPTEASFAQLDKLQVQKTQLQAKMDGFKAKFLPAFGVVLAVLVGVVIIGGIKRIGAAAEKVVPTMCIMYMAACIYIILCHIVQVPDLIGSIFSEAFSPTAFGGGLVGVLVIGVQRAAFSNEAGVGSASIAHSAAKTEEPIREGIVALMGPFIDTIVVCSMTALVILITGAWNNDAWVVEQGLAGASLTTRAFKEEISWFPYVLTVAVVMFAYSTIISWSYYGERCWERLFGPRGTVVYRALYVTCVLVGAIVNLGAVLDFSDMMILSMAFPNVLGCVLLAPKVKRDLADYWKRYKNDEFKTFK